MGNYNQDLKERGGGSNMYLTVPPHSVFAVCTVQYLFIGTVPHIPFLEKRLHI